MTDILIQFHALPEELIPVVRWAVADLGVHLASLRFFPFRVEHVSPEDVEKALLEPSIRELVLALDKLDLSAVTQGEFLRGNRGTLNLDIGRLSDRGLRESCLSCRTSDPRYIEAWRKVARKVRGMTKAGAIAVNPITGATTKATAHRHTKGARALDSRGIPMLPVAGGAVFHFTEKEHVEPSK